MILVDSLYINYGGGLNLLHYLVETLRARKIDFVLLQDIRCSKDFSFLSNRVVLEASIRSRYEFYKKNGKYFTAILCMANVPPPMRMKAKVYTYFHNINLLKIPQKYSFETKLKVLLKKNFIRLLQNNTDSWIVQTNNTENELRKSFDCDNKEVLICPFYKLPIGLNDSSKSKYRNDYVFVGDYSSAKGHDILLRVWAELYENGFNHVLHLTVDKCHEEFIYKIEDMKSKGVPVINHGCIPFEEVIDLYKSSKALIYPSLNESLGLGIIEAISAGCDVIASDLPFVYAICSPTCVFNPNDKESIKKALISYENGNNKPSILKVKDCIQELIDYII